MWRSIEFLKVLSISASTLLGIENDNKAIENNDARMEEEIRSNLFAEPLVLEFGSGLIPCVVEGLEEQHVYGRGVEM